MRDHIVYLSGPISGCSSAQATEWRRYVAQRLSPRLTVFDPTQDAADFSVPSELHLNVGARLQNLAHGKEVLERNRMYILGCDVVLANFLGAKKISIGSIGEIFWADAFRKPVIVVREAQQNLHDHGLVNAIATCTFEELDPAIDKINKMLY
jgi:hypothetical protein